MAPRLLEVLGLRRHRRAPGPADWPCTAGTVLSASLQVSSAGERRTEQPLVLYAYQVDGQRFQGDRLRYAGVPWSPAAVVDHCPAGSSVTVRYDPANPGNSALELS